MLQLIRTEVAKARGDRIIALVWLGVLASLIGRVALRHDLIFDSHGRPMPSDFLALWSAGQMVSAGHPADAYNYLSLLSVQVRDVGHSFTDYCPWNYPPLFLFVVGVLAQFPYMFAYTLWAITTLIAYFLCMRALFLDNRAATIYGGAPACFIAFVIAQTGLCLAAIFGAVLLTLDKRPIISGLLLAALAFKPQFGLLFPVALVMGGYWDVLLVAISATIAWVLLWLGIDQSVFTGFFHALQTSSQYYLMAGSGGWHKLQSIYAFLRMLGLGNGTASIVHGVAAAACLVIVGVAWRSKLPLAMKSAILALASLIATPYSYIYDFPVLTVAIGFLYGQTTFDRFERVAIWCAYALELTYLITGLPMGWAVAALIGCVIGRRLIGDRFASVTISPRTPSIPNRI